MTNLKLNKNPIGELHAFPLLFKTPNIYNDYCIQPNKLNPPDHPLVIIHSTHESKTNYNPVKDKALFERFTSLKNDDDIISFVKENGFLLGIDNEKANEDYVFFKNEIKIAKRLLDLYKATIQPHNSLQELKRILTVKKNPNYNDLLATFINEPKYIISFDGEEINQTPHIDKKTDNHGNTSFFAGITEHPYNYQFTNIDTQNPTHYKALALDIIAKTIHEKTRSIHLSFDHVQTKKDDSGNNIEGEDRLPQLAVKSCLYCPNLLALMYFQFYCFISSNQPVKPCKKCKTAFKPKSHKEKYCWDCLHDEYGLPRYPSQTLWNKKNRKKIEESKDGEPHA